MADPQLIVALEARLDKFEKQLKQAGVIAEQQIKEIEDKFSKMEITPGKLAGGTAAGQIIARVLEKAFEAFVEKIKAAIDEMNKLNELMKITTLSAERLQQIGFAARAGGVSDQSFFKGVEGLATQFDELTRKQTELGKFLDLNNIKYKDANGILVDNNRQWEIAAEVISRGRTELEKIKLAQMLGLSREWVDVLRDGADAFAEMQRKAKVDPELERSLRHMEALKTAAQEIGAEIRGWGTGLITFVLPSLQKMLELTGTILAAIAEQSLGTFFEQRALDALARWKSVYDIIKRANEAAEGTAQGPLKLTVRRPLQFPGDEESRTALDRFDEQLNKHIELLKAEAATVGLSNQEKEKARLIALLTAAAEKEGLTITEALTEERKKQIALASQQVQRNAELKHSIDELNSASKEFGSALAEAFKGMILEGKKLDEVLKNLANRMASRAIDKLFDFFFGLQGGQGKSVFAQLLTGITARQAGGPLGAGQAAIVGESGPELFVPKTAGKVIPNSALRSGGAGVEVRIINNTGQPVAQQERQGPTGRVLEITVGRLVRETINADLFQGGDIDRAMRSRFGLTPRLA